MSNSILTVKITVFGFRFDSLAERKSFACFNKILCLKTESPILKNKFTISFSKQLIPIYLTQYIKPCETDFLYLMLQTTFYNVHKLCCMRFDAMGSADKFERF